MSSTTTSVRKEITCASFPNDYFTDRHENDWGDSLNFDGPNSGPVREFFITNGRYWIEEFHFDGFRFDATQSIIDSSSEYIVGAIGRAARLAAGDRSIILVAENEPQETKLVRPRSEGGDDLDGLWNDDLHHSAMVALTGQHEAYYTDYRGRPQEFISAAKYGYLFQGQPYSWQEAPRGMPTFGVASGSFRRVHRKSRSGFELGLRRARALSTPHPGRYRAMTALLLLGPVDADAFSGPGIRRLEPVCLLHRHVGRLARRRFARAVSNSWLNFLRWPARRFRNNCPIRPIRKSSRAANSIFRSGKRTSSSTICTAIS